MPHADLEVRRAYMREYKRARRKTPMGREEHKAEQRARYAQRRDKLLADSHAYRAANPEKCSAADRAKRFKRRIAGGHRLTAADVSAVLDGADVVCAYCLAPCAELTVDHVVALSKCGSNDPNNLVAACLACNTSKQARSLLSWMFDLRMP